MIVKICGITTREAAHAAFEYGADLIGFVFAPSRRRIEVSLASKIIAETPRIGKVGIFADQPLQEVQTIANQCHLDFVQLHGNESPSYCKEIHRPVIKAFHVGADFSDSSLQDYASCAYLLFDSFAEGRSGGTGVPFDWDIARTRLGRSQSRFLVAGGLTSENVANAIRILQPDGVDVSGGVETNGTKDLDKIRRFIASARLAARGNENAETNRI